MTETLSPDTVARVTTAGCQTCGRSYSRTWFPLSRRVCRGCDPALAGANGHAPTNSEGATAEQLADWTSLDEFQQMNRVGEFFDALEAGGPHPRAWIRRHARRKMDEEARRIESLSARRQVAR